MALELEPSHREMAEPLKKWLYETVTTIKINFTKVRRTAKIKVGA